MLALRTGLRVAHRGNIQNLSVEGDSLCVIWWASGERKLLWRLADMMEDTADVARLIHY